jgi:hypothetical protein
VDVVINRSTRARGVYTGKEAAALDEGERNRHARSTLLRYNTQKKVEIPRFSCEANNMYLDIYNEQT